jgi:hypothetical protein
VDHAASEASGSASIAGGSVSPRVFVARRAVTADARTKMLPISNARWKPDVGDFDALLELLDPEVMLRVDAGPGGALARPPIVGRDAVIAEARRWAAMTPLSRPAVVNGAAGAVVGRPGHPFAVVGVTVANGRITTLDFVVDPAKLARITIPSTASATETPPSS